MMRNFARFLGMTNIEPAAVSVSPEVEVPDDSEIHEISVDTVVPNPYQPRKTFNDDSLKELAASIREHGIIQPILVRRTLNGFELIAGERRLRAAKIVGLEKVPVIVREINDKDMAELAMIENLQREDLHYLEEALGFQQLLTNFGMTQDELARRVGKNQSTIANKMRLLRLSPEVRQVLVDEQLTERHARALLKLEDPIRQQEALAVIRQNSLNVKETEELVAAIVEDISQEMTNKGPKQNIVRVIRDVRIFINTINHVVAEMKKAGLHVKATQEQDDEYVTINLRIPKRRK
jgi:ParB family chromosome partitioning protein